MKNNTIGRPARYPDTTNGFERFKKDTDKIVTFCLVYQHSFNMTLWAKKLHISRPTLYAIINRGGNWELMKNELMAADTLRFSKEDGNLFKRSFPQKEHHNFFDGSTKQKEDPTLF